MRSLRMYLDKRRIALGDQHVNGKCNNESGIYTFLFRVDTM